MKYMLDTNICIYIIRKRPGSVLKKFHNIHVGDICLSSITYAELMYGVYKSEHKQKNKKALSEFIASFDVMPFDDLASEKYGEARAHLEKKGLMIGSLDLMIASHALSLNTTLVTHNTKEFERVPHLKLVDWV